MNRGFSDTKIKAVYAGSFDPFTNGHLDIAQESASLFEELHIVIARNSAKQRRTYADYVQREIQELFDIYANVKVVQYDGLIADYCEANNIHYLVRGLRNTSDYLYEENIAKINQEFCPHLKTIYFRARDEVISSSMVWELYNAGKSVDKYLPYSMTDVLDIYARFKDGAP